MVTHQYSARVVREHEQLEVEHVAVGLHERHARVEHLAAPHLAAGLGLAAWGIVVVSWVDNVVRPLVISNATQMPLILVVFGVLGGVLAWLVERTDLPGKNLIFTFMAIGLLIPGFAAAMGWLLMLHPRIGLVNVWLQTTLGFAEAPFAPEVKAQLLKWRTTGAENTEAFRRTLDGMSYKQYLEGTLGFREEVTHYIEPVVGLINGATPDAVSAFAAQQIGMPATGRTRSRTGPLPGSFPGGNGTYARHFVKWLIPAAFPGEADFATLLTAKLNWAALDPKGSTQPTRIRLGSTVVRVEHDGAPGTAEGVRVWYAKGGRHYRVRARRVIMACFAVSIAYNWLGLSLALIFRIVMLFGLTFLMKLTQPLFSVFGVGLSWRDLILIGGGLFLISPEYIGPLLTTSTGQMVAGAAGCSMALGMFIMNKIATIKV